MRARSKSLVSSCRLGIRCTLGRLRAYSGYPREPVGSETLGIYCATRLCGCLVLLCSYVDFRRTHSLIRSADQFSSTAERTFAIAPRHRKARKAGTAEDPCKCPRRARKEGITGRLCSFADSRYGTGKASNVTIILDRPPANPIQLREPDANDLIYFQNGNAFEMFRIAPARQPHQTGQSFSRPKIWSKSSSVEGNG